MIPVGDGVADDTAAIQSMIDAANGDWVTLPAGTFRVTADLTRVGNSVVVYQPGLKIRGAGMLSTTILADYNGAANGGVLRIDTSAPGCYVYGNAIEDLRIKQASGRTGVNGILLTAAWYTNIRRVKIEGLSGAGIKAPLRTDIHPTISDYYQSLSLDIRQCDIRLNAGWGMDLSAGQSPGLVMLKHNMIYRNAGGGVRMTTGQSEIIANVFTQNGAYGGNGGLLFDTLEGPSFVSEVKQNEFDNNFSWHIHQKRVRGIHVHLNRFLSGTYSGNTGFTLASGSAFMRPYVHVNLGAGAANEVWNALYEKNYHRTVTGPGTTTASVIAYAASGGSLSPSFPCRFHRNDFGPATPDGITQNSTGFVKFSGLAGTGAEVLDP